MIDGVLITIGAVCMLLGIMGCALPFLPGPPISYAGLILLQLTSRHPFSTRFLIIFAIATAVVAFLDYVIPVYGTKRLKGSSYGIWGSALGLLAGMFLFPPVGIIAGPVVGAFLGELISGKATDRAFQSALGSFLGFVAGTAIKLALTIIMTYYFIVNIL